MTQAISPSPQQDEQTQDNVDVKPSISPILLSAPVPHRMATFLVPSPPAFRQSPKPGSASPLRSITSPLPPQLDPAAVRSSDASIVSKPEISGSNTERPLPAENNKPRFEPRSPGGSRQCTNCGETDTPQWRGSLCNACALWKRSRGTDRPLPLLFRRAGPRTSVKKEKTQSPRENGSMRAGACFKTLTTPIVPSQRFTYPPRAASPSHSHRASPGYHPYPPEARYQNLPTPISNITRLTGSSKPRQRSSLNHTGNGPIREDQGGEKNPYLFWQPTPANDSRRGSRHLSSRCSVSPDVEQPAGASYTVSRSPAEIVEPQFGTLRGGEKSNMAPPVVQMARMLAILQGDRDPQRQKEEERARWLWSIMKSIADFVYSVETDAADTRLRAHLSGAANGLDVSMDHDDDAFVPLPPDTRRSSTSGSSHSGRHALSHLDTKPIRPLHQSTGVMDGVDQILALASLLDQRRDT